MRIDIDLEEVLCSVVVSIIVLGILTAPWWITAWAYLLNKAECSVWVDKQMVYNGKCHFVSVDPVGEYGSSKRVSIYSDVAKFIQVKKYISEDVEIKDVVK